MGGTLYLKEGNPPGRGNVCISGYQNGKPNFALSNFHKGPGDNGYTFQDPDIGPVKFPTAEHYLHCQKLSKAGKAHLKDLYETMSPSQLLSFQRRGLKDTWGIPPNIVSQYSLAQGSKLDGQHYRAELQGWNKARVRQANKDAVKAWDKLSPLIQMQINASKYQQSEEFRDSIQESIDMGKAFGDSKGAATIIEDTSTADFEETNWGIGQDGRGTNWLGNSQTAFANMLQKGFTVSPGTLPTLASVQSPQVDADYQAATTQYQQGVQQSLIKVRNGKSKTDTSALGAGKVQKVTPHQVASKQVPSGGPAHAQPVQTAPQSAGLPPILHGAPFSGSKGKHAGALKTPGSKKPTQPSVPHKTKIATQELAKIYSDSPTVMSVKQKVTPLGDDQEFIGSRGPSSPTVELSVDADSGQFMFSKSVSYQDKKDMIAAVQAEFGLPPSNRKPDAKAIPLPTSLQDPKAPIRGVKGAAIDKGPFRTAMKLEFKSDADRDVAFDKFKDLVGNNVVKEKGGGLSVIGDEKSFDQLMQKMQPPEQQQEAAQRKPPTTGFTK